MNMQREFHISECTLTQTNEKEHEKNQSIVCGER